MHVDTGCHKYITVQYVAVAEGTDRHRQPHGNHATRYVDICKAVNNYHYCHVELRVAIGCGGGVSA